jgi:hypothetical protein
MAAAAHADDPVARVNGAGKAVLTDLDENEFAGNLFAIVGAVDADGSAEGNVHLVLAEPFSVVWGAVPGVDFIHLNGKVVAGAIADDGAVVLSGHLTEVDFSYADGVVFVEENVPFEIVVDPDAGKFTLQWCLLPAFDLEVTHGKLNVR